MLIVSISTLLFINPDASLNAMLTGAQDALKLSMTLVALYAFWLGFFALLEKTGISKLIAKLLRPVVKFLFPNSSDETRQFITLNMSANFLGLGNASTPMAIKAINSMDDGKSTKASLNMIMLVVISATSFQLLPTTVIGMRAARQSVNPTDFLPATLIATSVSTIIGVTLVKLLGLFLNRKSKKVQHDNNSNNKLSNRFAFIKTKNSKQTTNNSTTNKNNNTINNSDNLSKSDTANKTRGNIVIYSNYQVKDKNSLPLNSSHILRK